MSDNGGDTVSMTVNAEERPPDSGAVPDASTDMAKAAKTIATMTTDEILAAMSSSSKNVGELIILGLDLCYNYDEIVEAANAEYAESVGKSSVEGMSADEKRQAMLRWMLKQGEEPPLD